MPIKITAPTSFTPEFLRELARINSAPGTRHKIAEVFGSLPSSPVGSLRQAGALPAVDLAGLKQHVAEALALGFQFNYTLNSQWLGGLEGTPGGRKALLKHLAEVAECGVRRFTVSLPFLARLIKAHFPQVKISVSIVAGVGSCMALDQWAEYGADRVVVTRDINRNFPLLREISGYKGMELEALATSPCILNCQETVYHGLVSSHLSRNGKPAEAACGGAGYEQIYYCLSYALSHPEEFIKMPWIRPEDLGLYESAGVSWIKVDGRDKRSGYNLKRLERYCQGGFEGNLLHLLLESYPETFESFTRGFSGNGSAVFVDNRSLDGFVKSAWYDKGPCRGLCGNCGLCGAAAEKLVKIDKLWKEIIMAKLLSGHAEYLLKNT